MLAVKCALKSDLLARTRVLEKLWNPQHLSPPRRSVHLATLRGVETHDNDARALPLRALLVDAAGTLISPSEPVTEVISV